MNRNFTVIDWIIFGLAMLITVGVLIYTQGMR